MTHAAHIIKALGLKPHPEGGHYAETWRAEAPDGGRSPGTAIHFLLNAGEVSHWHRVDATEIWHWHAGSPLQLSQSPDGCSVEDRVLGPGIENGERPQIIVPSGVWQSAESHGAWTLVGCTVVPGFEFAGFELAPEGWKPGP